MLTSYYQCPYLREEKHFLVKISHGLPRHGRRPTVELEDLFPPEATTKEEAERLYRAQLERIGVKEIRLGLQEAKEAAGWREVVLCCFESLKKPGQWCHRRIFAQWWQERTGEVIAEFNS